MSITESERKQIISRVDVMAKQVHDDLETRLEAMQGLNPSSTSIGWVTNFPEYISWNSSSSAAVLWYADETQREMRTFAQDLVVKLLDQQRHSGGKIGVFWHFCEKQRSAEAECSPESRILYSIISQMFAGDYSRIDLVHDHLIQNKGLRLENLLYDSSRESEDDIEPDDDRNSEDDKASEDDGQPEDDGESDDDRGSDNKRLENLWDALVHALMVTPTKVYIIIDRIESIGKEARLHFLWQLLSHWKRLRSSLPTGIVTKFLITSSPRKDIRQALKGIPSIDQDAEKKR
jgi:hypothetical protein